MSGVNEYKASFLKQAKSSLKHLPRKRRIKKNFFAAQQFGHDGGISPGNSPGIVDFVDETAFFELPHDTIIDNVLDPQ